MAQPNLSIALYQPDIALNVGSTIRLSACLGLDLHVIEPCGFPWHPQKIRKSALDYIDHVTIMRHESWDAFHTATQDRRLILMTTKAAEDYTAFEFQDGDILIAGRESAGVPEDVHGAAHGRIKIPMHGATRSLNIVNATAMITGEALRQLKL